MSEGPTGRRPAVADATVLIYLSTIERLEDIWHRYEPVLVPAPVRYEVVTEGKRLEHPDAIQVELALEQGDLTLGQEVDAPARLEDVGIEHGDRAVLALALDRDIETILTDDGGLRAVARGLGLRPRGTLAFLIQALRDGDLSFASYLAELERLAAAGFRLSAELYARAVRRGREIAGEP